MAVHSLSKLQNIVWVGLFALLSTSAAAQSSSPGLTTTYPDSRTLRVQRKVDELFDRGEFDRAYFIYRNELVPLGDKYAQYMVGYMHLTGRGIEEDPVVASAWYRLAAERGTPEFKAVRDLLMRDMKAEERHRSDQICRELRREFSDLAILLSSIKRSASDLRPTTGSRLKAETSPMTVIEASSPNQSKSSAVYYRRIRRDLEGLLLMLAEIGDFPDLETDPTKVDIDEIERLVNERIEATMD